MPEVTKLTTRAHQSARSSKACVRIAHFGAGGNGLTTKLTTPATRRSRDSIIEVFTCTAGCYRVAHTLGQNRAQIVHA